MYISDSAVCSYNYYTLQLHAFICTPSYQHSMIISIIWSANFEKRHVLVCIYNIYTTSAFLQYM